MKEKFIEVYDDLVHPNLQDGIETLCKTNLPWYYTNNVAKFNDKFFPAMGHIFYMVNKNGDITNTSYFTFFLNILYSLSNKLKLSIEEVYAGRLFMHLPSPFSGNDEIHTDVNIPHWVCLYYVDDSEGDTILFKDDKKTIIKRVTPKKGRIVFFDGSIPHCSSRPSNKTRTIVNFDFKGKKL
jgi:hypothetical protein